MSPIWVYSRSICVWLCVRVCVCIHLIWIWLDNFKATKRFKWQISYFPILRYVAVIVFVQVTRQLNFSFREFQKSKANIQSQMNLNADKV